MHRSGKLALKPPARRDLRALFGGAIALAILAWAGPAGAAEFIVQARNYEFVVPGGGSSLTVRVGDRVTWVASGDPHTVTSGAPGAIDDRFADRPASAGILLDGESFTTTFTAPGTYPYFCEVHAEQMRGTVIVLATSTPSPTATPTESPASTSTPAPTRTSVPEASPRSTPRSTSAPSSSRATVGPIPLTERPGWPAPTGGPAPTGAPSSQASPDRSTLALGSASSSPAASATTSASASTASGASDAGTDPVPLPVALLALVGAVIVGSIALAARRSRGGGA
ncbi:MAG: hypothetical protein C0498_10240 [Anaerolinea sp.]|nr:hypothetical protein [Anaerolinea sp.]